jgi:tyrosyl-tRNA synthetase
MSPNEPEVLARDILEVPFHEKTGMTNKLVPATPEIERLLTKFARTTEEIVSLEEFRQLLASGNKLTLKYGADVTAPDLHFGHAVNLWMYRDLQELGHKVIFLIGDFTTRIGDPTGKSRTRPIIPEEQIEANTAEFIKQAKMVLIGDPEVLEIRRNS